MYMVSILRKPVLDLDRVVIVTENGTADIAAVYERDNEAIYASSPVQDYAIPIGDVTAHVGNNGRIYILAAKPDYVSDTVRLAALEKSIVLRQITQFTKPLDELKGGFNLAKILQYALIGVLLLAVVFK